ncbi:DUF4019 domain-containing protein [Qipengyuania sp. ASV99]|uniref:DUF4019 domain-containing protein n=1 Tax=Qipengyuania sp. ASV99 TaxID=3399681 RepID=UPI003A4C62A7
MAEPVEELTDKEKEALRLLLEGHDAKSSANTLGISVHTINDRLRNARRKMGVASSREAARILRDAGEDTPQIPVHTSLGIDNPEPAADTAILTQAKRAGSIRLTWLAGGMLIMSVVIAAAVLAVVSTSGGDAGTAVPSPQNRASSAEAAERPTPEDTPSVEVAEAFLSAIDAGDVAGSWDLAGQAFQTRTTQREWSGALATARAPLGDVGERRLATVQRVSTLPGLPEGDYEVLVFQAKFEGWDGIVTETLTMVRNGKTFDVMGYFVSK